MKEEAREYYHFLLTVCQDENIPLVTVYRQLREFLERLCRTQMPDGSLQMTDLSARVSCGLKSGALRSGTKPLAHLPTDFQCRTESAIRTFT